MKSMRFGCEKKNLIFVQHQLSSAVCILLALKFRFHPPRGILGNVARCETILKLDRLR